MEKVTDINVNTINSIPHVRIALSKLIKALEDYSPGDIDELEEEVENHEERIGGLEENVGNIEELIPAQASSSNQLADKEFVNSSIASNTGTYRGSYNLCTDLELEPTATHEIIANHLNLQEQGNNNDYCFVEIPTSTSSPTEISKVERYKWVGDSTGSWKYEYTIDNSSIPQLEEQVEDHDERIEELENTAVKTNSYDATVAVGLADNLRGDTVVNAEFYYRKSGGAQSAVSGIAAIKEVRGKSIVWNQLLVNGNFNNKNNWTMANGTFSVSNNKATVSFKASGSRLRYSPLALFAHKYYVSCIVTFDISTRVYVELSVGYKNAFENVNANERKTIRKILTLTDSQNEGNFQIYGLDAPVNAIIEQVNIIDLTLMFGAGNEPTTVAEFEKMFPLDYYDYNAGTIIPFAGENLVTTGFNQWDENLTKGMFVDVTTGELVSSYDRIASSYVAVLPNTDYYCRVGNMTANGGIAFYDANKNFISGKSWPAGIITTPNNTHYLRFSPSYLYGTTYKNDICINISDPDRNGTYEPYEKHTLPLDPSQWRDKQGNLVFPYGGMHGVGTAYDYAKVDADGYIRKVVRCFGQVDLGSLNWKYFNGNGYKIFVVLGDSISLNMGTTNLICSKYVYSKTNIKEKDKIVTTVSVYYQNTLGVNDFLYTNVNEFKAANQGVMLIFELAEPVEIELATPIYAKYLVDKDGTEEITPANGATPYTTMANLSILYAMDARGEIKNLPKNYLSKESAENMLNAMVSAGVIANYTMTWDAANNRYAFVITAPVEPEPEETND